MSHHFDDQRIHLSVQTDDTMTSLNVLEFAAVEVIRGTLTGVSVHYMNVEKAPFNEMTASAKNDLRCALEQLLKMSENAVLCAYQGRLDYFCLKQLCLALNLTWPVLVEDDVFKYARARFPNDACTLYWVAQQLGVLPSASTPLKPVEQAHLLARMLPKLFEMAREKTVDYEKYEAIELMYLTQISKKYAIAGQSMFYFEGANAEGFEVEHSSFRFNFDELFMLENQWWFRGLLINRVFGLQGYLVSAANASSHHASGGTISFDSDNVQIEWIGREAIIKAMEKEVGNEARF